MKNWLQNHRLRRQRSEATLLMQSHDSRDLDKASSILPNFPARLRSAARIAASHTSSRMSIERYLNAPLEQEPASVPAIDAALKRHNSQSQLPRPPGIVFGQHSRDSSFDVNSEGRRTFYTSASGPDSTGTSYSTVSRAAYHQRSESQPAIPNMPKLSHPLFAPSRPPSPERPSTGRTAYTERTWAERDPMEVVFPGYNPAKKTNYKTKAEEELTRIQEKAKKLGDQMRRFRSERDSASTAKPIITDEMAYDRMAQQPKLAWILGADAQDAKSIRRPKSSGSLALSALSSSDDLPSTRPSIDSTLVEANNRRVARRSKSIGALDDRPSQSTTSRKPVAGDSSKRVRFYCTFCQKRFHGRLEWMRHEQTFHMPEELWVCCPRTGEWPTRCPFCAKTEPSPSHLADHNYMVCQEKPLSERTFSRKDFFLQHVSHEHRISLAEKPLRLAELLEAWRHPLPLKLGSQALHCGFCGLHFSTYRERTEHVAEHFMAGMDMMSWWNGRVSHEVVLSEVEQNPYANDPHQCHYCERTYETLDAAQRMHPICIMYSCSFLPGMQYTIYPAGDASHLEAVCCYCNETLVKGDGKVKGAALKEHLGQHNFRSCNQRLYFSGQRFRQHLQDSHKTNYDFSLFGGWTLLLKSSRKEKVSMFRPVDGRTMRRAYTDPSLASHKPYGKRAEGPLPSLPKMNFMDFSETPNTSAVARKKLRRKASIQTMPDKVEYDEHEQRASSQFFTRTATMDFAYGELGSPSSRLPLSPSTPGPGPALSTATKTSTGGPKAAAAAGLHRPGYPVASHPVDAVNSCPKFYRRRVDASTRNRLYVRDELEGPLSKSSQRLFRKVAASSFGGLVLHSSLVGATPARLTNAVDIYSLH